MTFGLFLLFVVSWFLHLTERIPALGTIRFDFLLVCLIAVLSFLQPGEGEAEPAVRRIRRLLLAIVGYALVTLPLVEWPGSVLWYGLPNFAKAVVFYFFTDRLVVSRRKLVLLLVVFVSCQTFRIVEPVYLHVTTGYWGSRASMADWESMDRLSGAPSDIINPNGLAFVILTVLPFIWYLGQLRLFGRLAWLAVIPVSLYALVLTGSRSGLVGLAAIVLAVIVKSRRPAFGAVIVALCVAASVPWLGADTRDRYLSIVSNETRNAATAQGRMEGLWSGLAVAVRRPIFGHGLGTSREANANFGGGDQPEHNLYLETAQELGVLGLILFLAYVFAVARTVTTLGGSLRRADTQDKLLLRTNDAVQVWLAMNLLFSLAAFGLSGYQWYLMGGLSVVLRRLSPAGLGEAADNHEAESKVRLPEGVTDGAAGVE